MTSGSFDFAPVLTAGLPAPAAKWTGFPKYNFVGGHNDADHVPVDRLIAAVTAVLAREGRRSRPTVSKAGRSATARCASSWPPSSSAHAGISCTADEILITSGSLQAIDLVNGICWRAATPSSSSRRAMAARSTGWPGLGVKPVGIPLDGEGMRMDALGGRARRS